MTRPLWKRVLLRSLIPVVRWLDWDGRCGHPLDLRIGGLQFRCARPVGRIAFALFGRGLHRH